MAYRTRTLQSFVPVPSVLLRRFPCRDTRPKVARPLFEGLRLVGGGLRISDGTGPDHELGVELFLSFRGVAHRGLAGLKIGDERGHNRAVPVGMESVERRPRETHDDDDVLIVPRLM